MNDFVKIPEDYNPGITAKKWIDLIENPRVFKQDDLEYLKRICDYDAPFYAGDISLRYGLEPNTYSRFPLWKRIVKECGVVLPEGYKDAYYSVMLFMDKNSPARARYMVRDEVKEAVRSIDLSDIELYAPTVVSYCIDDKYLKYLKNGVFFLNQECSEHDNKLIYKQFIGNPLSSLVVVQCQEEIFLGKWLDCETFSVDGCSERGLGRRFQCFKTIQAKSELNNLSFGACLNKKYKNSGQEARRSVQVKNVTKATGYSVEELIKLINIYILDEESQYSRNGINNPILPTAIYKTGDDFDVECGKCGEIFRRVKRCTFCGQMLKWPNDEELMQYLR